MAQHARKRTASSADLVHMHRGPYLSQSAMAHVLREIRDKGLPGHFSRSAQARSLNKSFETCTKYGNVHSVVTLPFPSGPRSLDVQAPIPMLCALVRQAPPCRALMRDVLRDHPCSLANPWHLVIYFDGISPQNPLARGRDHRKVESIYYSFLEFGNLLSDEAVWMCVAAARHTRITSLDGGMSHYVGAVLEQLFFSKECDISRHGVDLDLSDAGDSSELRTLYADHKATIADALAIEEVLLNTGHNGTKPCPCCRNIIDHRQDYAAIDASGFLQPLTTTDMSLWKPHTDASVRDTLHRVRLVHVEVAAGRVAPSHIKTKSQVTGYKWSAHHIALNAALNFKSISALCFDAMHVFCVDGVFHREVRALLDSISEMSTPLLHAYVQRWRLPAQFKSGSNVFETGSFQASASEVVTVSAILMHYFKNVAQGAFPDHPKPISSFLLCCEVLEAIQLGIRGSPAPTGFHDLVVRHLRAHLEAYGDKYWVFKHHQALHIPTMWVKFGRLLTCWVQERKHKVVKRFIVDSKNPQGYEKKLMAEVTAQCVHDWSSWSRLPGLMRPRVASGKVLDAIKHHLAVTGDVFVSSECASPSAKFSRGDFVVFNASRNHAAGRVWFFFENNNWRMLFYGSRCYSGPQPSKQNIPAKQTACI